MSGATLNAPILTLQGSKKERIERKDLRKYLKRKQPKTFLMQKKKWSPKPREDKVLGTINPMRITLRYKVVKVKKLKDKPATFRRGEYKCRILETHLKLIQQQQKTICIQTAVSKSHGNCKPKSTVDIQIKKGIQAPY